MFGRWKRRRDALRSLDEDLEQHLDQQMEENLARGMSGDDARRTAMRQFGNVALTREETRSVWSLAWLERSGQDLRNAIRALTRQPLILAAGGITIALCVAANTTVFTIANGIALKEPPFTDPGRVVHIDTFDQREGPSLTYGGAAYPDFLEFRAQNRSFEDVAFYRPTTFNISGDGVTPQLVDGVEVGPNLFSLLGYRLAIGRDFIAGEDQPGAAPAVIISDSLWQGGFGGVDDVVGRQVKVDTRPYTIVGVMPPGMRFPVRSELWIPAVRSGIRGEPDAREGGDVVARLREGVSENQAGNDVGEIAARIREAYPVSNSDVGARIVPFLERYSDPGNAAVFTLLFGAVGFVLLIACSNLAGLMLAKAFGRSREMAIRLALGAGRVRIMRQFLLEGLVLTLIGGAAGFALALGATRVLANELGRVGLPYWVNFSLDYRIVVQMLAICVLTALLIAIAPALKLSGKNIHLRIGDGDSRVGSSRTAGRLTALLIAGEVALTLVLLTGASFMIRNFLDFQLRDPGLPTEELLTATFVLPETRYPGADDRIQFQEELLARLESQPGLGPVALASHAPLMGRIQREVEFDQAEPRAVSASVVTRGFFDATGIGILRGRDFTEQDGLSTGRTAIVSEHFASIWWPGASPLGRQFRFANDPQTQPLTVIGVSRDIGDRNGDVEPAVYIPHRQESFASAVVITRGGLSREAVIHTLQAEVESLDPDLPLFAIRTIDEYLWALSVGNRVLGSLFSAFALIALSVSLVGIYGVTAYSLVRRAREIAIRIALGASNRSVLWLAVRQGAIYSGVGVVVGLFGAWAVSRFLLAVMADGLPGQASATDATSLIVIAVSLVIVTLGACLMPAINATRNDPASTLRAD